jgi:leucyl/phenylalanyl-tRNA---protein transferase
MARESPNASALVEANLVAHLHDRALHERRWLQGAPNGTHLQRAQQLQATHALLEATQAAVRGDGGSAQRQLNKVARHRRAGAAWSGPPRARAQRVRALPARRRARELESRRMTAPLDAGPSVEQAIALYAAGYFPMDDPAEAHGPLPFYAAEQRAVFDLGEDARAALRRRLGRSLRAGEGWRLVHDERFHEVVAACARPREPGDGVWITPRLQGLYRRLHEVGLAHSFEIDADGELAAGLIAVLLGRAAMLESMFHTVPHAGNVLLSRTLDDLAARGFALCDIQLPTEHTTRLGARLISREEYEQRLRDVLTAS